MEWNHSNTIGLANSKCTSCHGMGMRSLRQSNAAPCKCVFRAAFRACFNRFRSCVASSGSISRVSVEMCDSGKFSKVSYGRRTEEYVADFWLVSKRTLDAFEWKLFTFHFLLGADWRLCCRRLHMDRGNFFHACYRIEQKLGRTFVELKPFALYPLDEYFGGTVRGERTQASITQARVDRGPLRPVLVRPAVVEPVPGLMDPPPAVEGLKDAA